MAGGEARGGATGRRPGRFPDRASGPFSRSGSVAVPAYRAWTPKVCCIFSNSVRNRSSSWCSMVISGGIAWNSS